MKSGTCIRGVGAYIPEEVRGNDFWPRRVVDSWRVRRGALERLVDDAENGVSNYLHPALVQELKKIGADPFQGFDKRRVAPREMLPSDMQVLACKDALDDAGIDAEKVDILLEFALPPDQVVTPNAFTVHRKLGLGRTVCFGVNSICHSLMTAMEVGRAYIESGRARYVLAVVATKYSDTMDYSSSLSVAAGDGAGAFLLGPCDSGGVLSYVHGVDTEFHHAILGVPIVESPPRVPSYHFGEIIIRQKFVLWSTVPEMASKVIARIPRWAETTALPALEEAGLDPGDVDVLVTNAAMTWYSRVVADILKIPHDRIEDNILDFSNMGASNLPINLYMAVKRGRIRTGSKVLLFGHGAGGSYGAAVVQWP